MEISSIYEEHPKLKNEGTLGSIISNEEEKNENEQFVFGQKSGQVLSATEHVQVDEDDDGKSL